MRGVGLDSDIGVERMRGDEDLLRRTLANLVENAIRHAPVNTSIGIAATRTEEGVEIRVADRGPGIPEQFREKIFEPFVQLDDAGRVMSRSGRGLGLAFCKLAVEAHGGSISVDDQAPGVAFTLRLPQRVIAPRAAVDLSSIPPKSQRSRAP